MRITFVVHQFLPHYFTGTEQYAFALAKSLRAQGHDVDVFTLDPDFAEREPFWEEQREDVDGVPVTRFRHWMHLGRDFGRLEYQHPYAGYRFAQHLDARRPDLVHVFHLRHVGGNLLAECRVRGIPSVVHLMDFWFLCPHVTLLKGDGTLCDGPPELGFGCIACHAPVLAAELQKDQLEPAVRARAAEAAAGAPPSTPDRTPLARAASLVERPHWLRTQLALAARAIAPSEFLRDVFVQNGYPDEAITVVTYGVDRERLASLPAERPERAPNAPLRVGYFGSIAPHKGVHLLVDAVTNTPTAALRLVIYGRTTDFPDFATPLVECARLDPRVEFREPFAREELGRALSSIDVLVVPSRWYENSPFVILEAQAGGVPVIATALGGTTELIEDGIDGELFARGDANDLSARLARLAAEPERLARYREALPKVKTLEQNVDELLAIYREVLG